MHGGKHHHWGRSIAFLAVWVVFGGVVLAGWLAQLHPSADPVTDDLWGSSFIGPSDTSTPATTTAITTAPAANTTVPKPDTSTPATDAVVNDKPPVASNKTTTSTPLGTLPKATAVKATTTQLNAADKVAHPFGIELGSYISNLYQWALVIGAGLAVMMIMWAGYTYVVSAGDPEAVRVAKDYLWGALLGLALLILTFAVFNTLKVGVPEAPAVPAAAKPADNTPLSKPASDGSQTIQKDVVPNPNNGGA